MKRSALVVGEAGISGEIQDILYPLDIRVVSAVTERGVKSAASAKDTALAVIDGDSPLYMDPALREKITDILRRYRKKFIVASSQKDAAETIEAKKFGAADHIIKPFNYREFIARVNAVIFSKKRIACIGGGTGLFQVLLGLKKIPNILLTSVVSMSDDGGSSGRLIASFGVLPPGDIRRSIVALSNAPEVMNEVMRYRFTKGEGLAGHNLGNLLLTALADIKGSFSQAAKATSDILNVQGIVIGVTENPTTLCAEFEDGTVIKGESKIDLAEGRSPELRIKNIWHEPATKCNIEAFSDIVNSDFLIIGPGDLYTSVTTNLLVNGIKEALYATEAKVIYICNLMTKPGETNNFTALDHIREIVRYIGSDRLDHVVISNTKIKKEALEEYAKKGQYPVAINKISDIRSVTKAMVTIADVGHESELVRHDSAKLRKAICGILSKESGEIKCPGV